MPARLARHGRRRKPLRWHIDYLSAKAAMLGAILIPGGRDGECSLAAEVARLHPRPVPRFGASDCRCAGHLFYAGRWWERRGGTCVE
jgi:sugar fermentation stimulation protein A